MASLVVSLLRQLVVIMIFDRVSLVEQDEDIDVDGIAVVEDDMAEDLLFALLLMLLLLLVWLLILDMADDEDEVSNDRGNTWGFKGKSKIGDLGFCFGNK